MNSSRLIRVLTLLALALVFALALPTDTSAETKVKKTVAPPPIDTRILVTAVDVNAKTIVIQYMRDAKQPTHMYSIDDFTALTVNNVKGTIAQIKVGMQVRSYTERDDKSLDTLTVDQADPPPVVPKKK